MNAGHTLAYYIIFYLTLLVIAFGFRGTFFGALGFIFTWPARALMTLLGSISKLGVAVTLGILGVSTLFTIAYILFTRIFIDIVPSPLLPITEAKYIAGLCVVFISVVEMLFAKEYMFAGLLLRLLLLHFSESIADVICNAVGESIGGIIDWAIDTVRQLQSTVPSPRLRP